MQKDEGDPRSYNQTCLRAARWHTGGVTLEYDDLPHWEFSVVEISPGRYRGRAIRVGGIIGEATSIAADDVLVDLRRWAQKVEHELASKS